MEIYGGTGNFSRGRHASGAATTRTKSKRTRPDPQKSRVAWPSPLTTATKHGGRWKMEKGMEIYIYRRGAPSLLGREEGPHTHSITQMTETNKKEPTHSHTDSHSHRSTTKHKEHRQCTDSGTTNEEPTTETRGRESPSQRGSTEGPINQNDYNILRVSDPQVIVHRFLLLNDLQIQ